MSEFRVLPSLCGGSLAEWQTANRQQGWKMTPTVQGIEAMRGRAGLSGNWCQGYVVLDHTRRPFELGTVSLQEAINVVETRGEELAAARDSAESKEK